MQTKTPFKIKYRLNTINSNINKYSIIQIQIISLKPTNHMGDSRTTSLKPTNHMGCSRTTSLKPNNHMGDSRTTSLKPTYHIICSRTSLKPTNHMSDSWTTFLQPTNHMGYSRTTSLKPTNHIVCSRTSLKHIITWLANIILSELLSKCTKSFISLFHHLMIYVTVNYQYLTVQTQPWHRTADFTWLPGYTIW